MTKEPGVQSLRSRLRFPEGITMSPELYSVLSDGNGSYFKEHEGFGVDLRDAIKKMERMLSA